MRLCATLFAALALAATVAVGPAAASAEDAKETPAAKAEDAEHGAGKKFARTCQALQSAAHDNGLPVSFFTKLIWQESRFDADAVSPAGARGVAQFMPGTAAWLGLADPHDVSEAIAASAKFLHDLNKQFGNLGLAAAAYNAGPGRVQDWLNGGRGLPAETEAYVRIVTGKAVEVWRSDPPAERNLTLPDAIPCPQLVKLLAEAPESSAPQGPAARTATRSHVAPWGLQLIGGPSQKVAMARFREMQKTYRAVLGGREPLVLRSRLFRNNYWYRVRVGAPSYLQAQLLCRSLIAAGGECIVQRNN